VPDRIAEEFREFVAARSAALMRTAYLLTGDWATAEDLLQTALTKTYLAWRRLGTIEAVEPYARRVLVTTATSWWRRRWNQERPTGALPDSGGPDGADERAQRDLMWRFVCTLPVRQRAVLVLRFYEDMTETDTARLLGISVGTVKSQGARALATLRRRLAEQGIEPAARRGASPAPPVTALPGTAGGEAALADAEAALADAVSREPVPRPPGPEETAAPRPGATLVDRRGDR
jgi:RNA polymerase sigma-70 factor, ECF subfamily